MPFPNVKLPLFELDFYMCDCVSAVPDNLPALSDHHANPDPGLAAAVRAFLP